jgi:hypothetical protein
MRETNIHFDLFLILYLYFYERVETHEEYNIQLDYILLILIIHIILSKSNSCTWKC